MAALVLAAACLVQTPAFAQQTTLPRPQPKPPGDIPVLSERADKGDRCCAMMALGVAYETGDGVASDFAAANRCT